MISAFIVLYVLCWLYISLSIINARPTLSYGVGKSSRFSFDKRLIYTFQAFVFLFRIEFSRGIAFMTPLFTFPLVLYGFVIRNYFLDNTFVRK